MFASPPRPQSPSTSRRAESRRQLEDVAAQLFASQGYAATTVDQIVAAAHVSKPALYRHFDSKKELYLVLLRRHQEQLAQAALEHFEPEGDLRVMMEAMVDAWFRHVEAHPYTWRMLFRDVTGDPDIEALHADLHRAQVGNDMALLRAVDPPLPSEQVEPLAEAIRASLAGLALWWLAHPDTPRAVLVATMVRMLGGLVV